MSGKFPRIVDRVNLVYIIENTAFDFSVLSETVYGPRLRINVSIILNTVDLRLRQKRIVFVRGDEEVDVAFETETLLLNVGIDPVILVVGIKVDYEFAACTELKLEKVLRIELGRFVEVSYISSRPFHLFRIVEAYKLHVSAAAMVTSEGFVWSNLVRPVVCSEDIVPVFHYRARQRRRKLASNGRHADRDKVTAKVSREEPYCDKRERGICLC